MLNLIHTFFLTLMKIKENVLIYYWKTMIRTILTLSAWLSYKMVVYKKKCISEENMQVILIIFFKHCFLCKQKGNLWLLVTSLINLFTFRMSARKQVVYSDGSISRSLYSRLNPDLIEKFFNMKLQNMHWWRQ